MSIWTGRQRVTVRRPANSLFVEIPELDYYGSYSCSTNGRFILTWKDAYEKKCGPGRCLLIEDNNHILTADTFERPNFGTVANNGTFAVQDWLYSMKHNGRFIMMNSGGHSIVNHYIGTANLRESTISDDGLWATCSAGEYIYFFDLSKHQLAWRKKVNFNFNGVIIGSPSKEIYLLIGDGEAFRFNFDGDFLDVDAMHEYEIKEAYEDRYGYQLLDLAHYELEKIDNGDRGIESLDQVCNWIKAAKGKQASPNVIAERYRFAGEVAENNGQQQRAMELFKQAIAHNPRIGVMRKLKQLQKSEGKKV